MNKSTVLMMFIFLLYDVVTLVVYYRLLILHNNLNNTAKHHVARVFAIVYILCSILDSYPKTVVPNKSFQLAFIRPMEQHPCEGIQNYTPKFQTNYIYYFQRYRRII